MCRNIKALHHFEPPITEDEIRLAALQYVRKVSSFNKPSGANEAAFALAVDEIAAATRKLLDSLEKKGAPKDRNSEAEKARQRTDRRLAR